jgi:hypothetical protein
VNVSFVEEIVDPYRSLNDLLLSVLPNLMRDVEQRYYDHQSADDLPKVG